MKYLMSLILLSGCGVTVHSDPIKINPIVVQGSLSINFAQVMSYCVTDCTKKTPNDPGEISKCSTDCYNQFFQIFNYANQGVAK